MKLLAMQADYIDNKNSRGNRSEPENCDPYRKRVVLTAVCFGAADQFCGLRPGSDCEVKGVYTNA